MKRRAAIRRIWLFALLLTQTILPLSTARATDRECSGQIVEPGLMQIECRPGYAGDHDRLQIFSTTDFDPARDWREQLNTTDAAWIFDAAADDTANLIILFERRGSELRASIFDDQSNDRRVAYRRDRRSIRVTESEGRPTVLVTTKQGWIREDGGINFNYDITIDGSVEGMIDASSLYLDRLKNDGKTDLTVHVRDIDNDGRPDYEWRQAYPPLAEEDGFYHTSVMVNNADDEPPIADALFWPLLGDSATGFIKGGYGNTSEPPINVDWQRSKINYLVESVASRNRPHNFFVYSIRRVTEGKLNDVNFESPFAFYQFSPQGRNFPDLALRVAYYPENEVAPDLPIEQVDFSWRQEPSNLYDQPNWDYRLGLLGHNPHQGQIDLPDFSLKLTPYAQLPRWAVDNDWDYASFVARESGEYLSSEGMYEWATLEGVVVDVHNQEPYLDIAKKSQRAQEDYVRGADEKVSGAYYQQIRSGLRGEFRSRSGPAKLYFSPIDRKLHMLGADHGVWQIDEQRALRYANLDGDGYLDQWTYTAVTTGTATITTTRQLNVAASHLLYAGDGGVTIRQSRAQPSLFETLPPADRAEWQTLGRQLNAHQRSFAPEDLTGLLEQFAGPELRIGGAGLRDYRPTERGFRFVLTLEPGFTTQGAALLRLQNLPPGEYVVSYDGSFTIQPLTPPALSATLHTRSLNQLQPSALQLTLRNDGLQDHPAATLELWAEQPAAKATLVASDTVTLLAQQPISVTLNWTPPSAGMWTFTPRLRNADASVTALEPAAISITPTQVISADVLIAASASFKTLPLIVLVALIFAGLAAYIWREQWRTEGVGR
jgi:hypothetical protein